MNNSIEVGTILENQICNSFLFRNYQIDSKKFYTTRSPTIIDNTEIYVISLTFDRTLFFRIETFNGHHKLKIWVNKLKKKENNNLDVEQFLIQCLNKKNIKNFFEFNAISITEIVTSPKNRTV